MSTTVVEERQSTTLNPTQTSTSERLPVQVRKTVAICVSIASYADDVNPLITTRNSSRKEHRGVVHDIVEEEGATDKLGWDPSKESCVEFGVSGETITLGIHINSKLDFSPHKKARTGKAQKVLNVMSRLDLHDGKGRVSSLTQDPRGVSRQQQGKTRPDRRLRDSAVRTRRLGGVHGRKILENKGPPHQRISRLTTRPRFDGMARRHREGGFCYTQPHHFSVLFSAIPSPMRDPTGIEIR